MHAIQSLTVCMCTDQMDVTRLLIADHPSLLLSLLLLLLTIPYLGTDLEARYLIMSIVIIIGEPYQWTPKTAAAVKEGIRLHKK